MTDQIVFPAEPVKMIQIAAALLEGVMADEPALKTTDARRARLLLLRVLARMGEGEATEAIPEVEGIVEIDPNGKYIMLLPVSMKMEDVQRVASQVSDWMADPNSPVAVIGGGTKIFRVPKDVRQESGEETDRQEAPQDPV